MPATPSPSPETDDITIGSVLDGRYRIDAILGSGHIDVQVDRREWEKYGVHDGPDMSDSLVLIDDLVADAQDLGLRALDATAALRGAEPGAFLDHDIHMTAKGHAAVATALAATLTAPRERP